MKSDFRVMAFGVVMFDAGSAYTVWRIHAMSAWESVGTWLGGSLVSLLILWVLFWLASKRDAWFSRRRLHD